MMDLEGNLKYGGIIISPYPSSGNDNIDSNLSRITTVFLDKLSVRNNYKEAYIEFINSDEPHATLLQKAYFSVICALWCSYSNIGIEDTSERTIFLIKDAKSHIDKFVQWAIEFVCRDPYSKTPHEKFAALFQLMEDTVITPLFTQGTFGYIFNTSYESAMFSVWDVWVEEFMFLEHSTRAHNEPDDMFTTEKYRNFLKSGSMEAQDEMFGESVNYGKMICFNYENKL
jgi:hypothetical protein